MRLSSQVIILFVNSYLKLYIIYNIYNNCTFIFYSYISHKFGFKLNINLYLFLNKLRNILKNIVNNSFNSWGYFFGRWTSQFEEGFIYQQVYVLMDIHSHIYILINDTVHTIALYSTVKCDGLDCIIYQQVYLRRGY